MQRMNEVKQTWKGTAKLADSAAGLLKRNPYGDITFIINITCCVTFHMLLEHLLFFEKNQARNKTYNKAHSCIVKVTILVGINKLK